ncbi:MAG: hypothetical protein GY853_10900 [PVC group bacterium]|nr:hypothetical protein [PVC group bacterium]
MRYNKPKKTNKKRAQKPILNKNNLSEEIMALIAFENSIAAQVNIKDVKKAHTIYSRLRDKKLPDITPDFLN